ncbi:MAG TPA: magnesium transporter [Azoarcus taiwanensis]|nr:magnesium transporter [Azoarcus taiwanensis]
MSGNHLSQGIEQALASGEHAHAHRLVKHHHLADIADRLMEMPDGAIRNFLHLAPESHVGELLDYFDTAHQARLLTGMDRPTLVRVFRAMDTDDQADLLQRLEPTEREHVLPALAQVERDALLHLASYPEGSVGAVMTSDYVTVRPSLTAREAIEQIRVQAPDKETIYQVFVLDEARRLAGTVSLRELIVSAASTTVGELMRRDVVHARADEPQKVAAELIARYDLIALPVVDADQRLVGIVTYDDAMDVHAEETTDLFHKAGGGVGHVGERMRDASIALLYRKRITWLVLLVFANIFSGAGIAAFEDTIAAHVALVFFLPLLIDSGGNAGSQSATLMVRALATGEARLGDWGRMLGREFGVAALLGVTMALAVSTLGLLRGGPEIALVVALSMMVIVVVGSTIGLSVPFLLSRFGRDPATASAPLITSVADITGVVIYFAIATAILPGVVG